MKLSFFRLKKQLSISNFIQFNLIYRGQIMEGLSIMLGDWVFTPQATASYLVVRKSVYILFWGQLITGDS